MRAAGMLAVVLGTGCAEAPVESEFESSNLETARVVPAQEIVTRVDVLGHLSVARDGSAWDIGVATPSARYAVEVVSPGGADLSVFDGLDARVSIARVPGSGEYSVSLLTPEGEVLYLLEPAQPGALTELGFGRGLIDWANDLGPVVHGGWTVNLWSAWLRTDGAEVELLPGEPRVVWIRMREYRVVLLSAWDVAEEADGCAIPASRLAFEVVRADSSADETPLERDPAVPLVGESCEDEA